MWFRIELDNTGAILSCTEVELAERDKRFVRFIEAPDKAQACTSVKQWWEQRMRRRRENLADWRDQKKQAGICTTCKAPAVPGRKMCQAHLDKHKGYKQRLNERREQGIQPRPKQSEEVTFLSYVEPAIKASRILYEFDRRGPKAFREWVLTMLRERLKSVA